MEPNIDAMSKISGSATNDAMLASAFCQAAQKEAGTRLKYLKSVEDLSVILDEESLQQARSSLAGIAHIQSSVKQIADFHSNGSLSAALNKLSCELDQMLKEGKEIYGKLRGLYPD